MATMLENLVEVRRITKAPYRWCKEALTAADGDIAAAVESLRYRCSKKAST